MKNFLLIVILSFSAMAHGQSIQSAEYFFDTDPGVGNAIPLTITAADTVNFSGNIPTTNLSVGHHHLFVRIKNAQGEWSHYFSRMFYINNTSLSTSPPLIAAEYFYNTDPGTGNGNNISSTLFPDDTINISTTLPTTGLTGGWDTLFVRVKDSLGVWSMTMAKPFLLCANRMPSSTISGGLQICIGDTLQLSAASITGAVSYLWTGPNNFSATGQSISIPNATAGDAGTYAVRTVRTGGTGCDTSDAVQAIVVVDTIAASPTVSITANPGGAVCAGTSINFTATSANATSTYQWFIGSTLQSTTGATFTTTPSNNDQVSCVVSSNAVCVNHNTDTSNIITVTTNPLLTPTLNISASQDTVCSGVSVTLTATAVHGGSAPAYQWNVNNMNAGSNSSTYNYIPTNGDIIHCELTSNEQCISVATVNSNNITLTVNPVVTPTLSIVPDVALPVCENAPITFTATSTHTGNTNPYIWEVNGILQPSTGNIFSGNTWTNNDRVTCTIVSDIVCAQPASVSDTMDVTVISSPVPSVSITANPGVFINPGDSVTFIATTVNGGVNPIYKWMKNGIAINGETTNAYTTNTLQHGDTIHAIVYSNEVCAEPDSAISNTLVMSLLTGAKDVRETTSTISVFPNPTKSSFTISGTMNKPQDIQIHLINAIGQSVYTEILPMQDIHFAKNVHLPTALSSGIYTLSITFDNKQRFVMLAIN